MKKFVDNAKKRSEDFQYVWIAERQTTNDVFESNIHFHMITNKYWRIDKWWKYGSVASVIISSIFIVWFKFMSILTDVTEPTQSRIRF